MNKTTRLHIGGMTCVNCQNRIEKALKHMDGVISARVSYNDAAADIVYDEEKISLIEICTEIERLDYKVMTKDKAAGTSVLYTAGVLAIIVLLYVLLQALGILNLLVPSQLADTTMGYGMLFVIGLITSVHCISMCGGINLSQCLPQTAQGEPDQAGKAAALRPALSYNLGRVLSYTAIGFLLGLAGFLMGGGAEVGLSALLQGILKIIAGLFMVVMGISMLGIFPGLRRFALRMPGFLARKIGKQRAKTNRPFIVGVLNGFMPCGPLQSMWIVALASGNPAAGALSMLLFSLGTVPLMLGLGSIVSALGRRFADKVMTVGAVLVVVLGLAMISQGGSLSGWLPPDLLLILIIALCIAGLLLILPAKKRAVRAILRAASLVIVIGACAVWHCHGPFLQDDAAQDVNAEVVGGVQVINSTLSPGRYPNITVQAGVPVKWVIDAPQGSINGCNNRILIRDYGIEYAFHPGENVIEFTPTDPGTVRYSCWMGMIRGNIFVTDGTEAELAAAGGDVSVPTPAGYAIPTDQMAVAVPATDDYGNEAQKVAIALTDEGFSPAIVVVQRNLLAYWSIDNSLSDADTVLSVPYYSIQLPLEAGQNLLSLYPNGNFEASIGDNRFYCYVKVVDDLNAVDEAAIKAEVAAFEPLVYPQEIYQSAGSSCCY